jgi:ABC-type nitrate/sulfonate/bicarbonate transport system permease component
MRLDEVPEMDPIAMDREVESAPKVLLPQSNDRGWFNGLGFVTLIVLLAIWEAVARVEWVGPYLLPAPSALAESFYDLCIQGFPSGIILPLHILITLWRVVLGFLLAAVTAIPLGLLIGRTPLLDKLSASVITFGRSLAAISLLPLFIAWFGIGEFSKIMLIALGTFWVMITYTIASVKLIDPVLIRAAQSMDTPQRALFVSVILPASLPRIFTGLRVSLAVAFYIIVAAEMIATVEGVGTLIMEGRNAYRTDVTMVGMIVIGLLGWAFVKLLAWMELRIAPWAVEEWSQ